MMMAINESGAIMLIFMLVHITVIYLTSAAPSTNTNTTSSTTDSSVSSQNASNSFNHKPPDTILSSSRRFAEDTNNQSRYKSIPQEQRIALQIVIVDPPPNSTKKAVTQHKRHSNLVIGRKRPYDTIMQDVADKYSPSAKHFYVLDAQPTENTILTNKEDTLEEQQQQEKVKQQLEVTNKPPRRDLENAILMMNQKIELIRTQHKPPWQTINNQHSEAHLPFEKRTDRISDGGTVRRYKLRYNGTTIAPSTTTTEFFRLMSSAHSPIELITRTLELPGRKWNQQAMNSVLDFEQSQNKIQNQHQQVQKEHHMQLPASLNISNLINVLTTVAPKSYHMELNESLQQSRFNPNVSIGRVVSPTIVVIGDKNSDDADEDQRRNTNENIIENSGLFVGDRGEANATLQVSSDGRPSFKIPLGASEIPTTFFDGKKKVTIIRHSPRPTEPPVSLLPPLQPDISIPEKIKIDDDTLLTVPNLTITTLQGTNQPPQLVRLISKQKHKYDDNIRSSTLTVVDSHAIRMPPNATSVHNNKLIVAIRPGRPRHRYPSTTQFPVYNIVAGITPPYTTNPVAPQFTRPPSIYGQVYGLLKPNGTDPTSTTAAPSNFGAPNIKFPAMASSLLQPEHIELPEKVNISIPDTANLIGPHKVPDKILMGIEEQHSRPPDAVVLSDSTIISRPPYGHVISNHDGIMQLGTTRKPTRLSTTKRINIVSANTTVIHQTHQLNTPSRPPPVISKPSIFEYISTLLNAGVTTSAVAVLTLIKTIFVAILVMFLPPIALTAAITQAVSLG